MFPSFSESQKSLASKWVKFTLSSSSLKYGDDKKWSELLVWFFVFLLNIECGGWVNTVKKFLAPFEMQLGNRFSHKWTVGKSHSPGNEDRCLTMIKIEITQFEWQNEYQIRGSSLLFWEVSLFELKEKGLCVAHLQKVPKNYTSVRWRGEY